VVTWFSFCSFNSHYTVFHFFYLGLPAIITFFKYCTRLPFFSYFFLHRAVLRCTVFFTCCFVFFLFHIGKFIHKCLNSALLDSSKMVETHVFLQIITIHLCKGGPCFTSVDCWCSTSCFIRNGVPSIRSYGVSFDLDLFRLHSLQ